MGILNRAATGLFSLSLVSALIVGGHWIAGRKKHHALAAPVKHVTTSVTAISTMPDCKMPESPPASGPLRCSQAAGMAQTNAAQDCDAPFSSGRALAQTVVHAASGRETDSKRPGSAIAGPRVADASESSAPYYPQPMPLPARTDAVPIRPDGPEVPILGEPPGSAPLAPPPGLNPLGRKIIERALPNSSDEERDAWHDTLKDLAPKDVRELMRLRQELGRMPPSVFESRPPVGQFPIGQLPGAQPLWSQTAPGPIASEPLAPPTESLQPRLDAEREVARTIATSLHTINQAQQTLLNSIANDLHELERLRRQAHALELAAQSLLSNSLDPLAPVSNTNAIPSHFAGVPERDRH
ncbi:MAG TPA: hypothetical protein VFG04_19935 [Planctomycetaceae bacterium]|jgi:hypothetical protein|nr:hypothetical protein [Planctomycetaceae bacterium]